MTPAQLNFTRSSDPRQHILISIGDIVRIEVSCNNCGTTLSLDTAANEKDITCSGNLLSRMQAASLEG